MNHTTISMQTLLNQPLDPNLCKRILQEIKSPLMEQSFAMTNDESLSRSWINAPKRPNIPPPSNNSYQSCRPIINNMYNSSHDNDTKSFYAYEHSYPQFHNENPYNENKSFLQTIAEKFDCQIMGNLKNNYRENINPNSIDNKYQQELIVSPLDPNITMTKFQQHNQGTGIWGHLCGNLLNTGQEIQHEIGYDEVKQKFHRKKIFDSKAKTLLQNTRKNHHIVQQSILLIKEQKSHIQVNKNQDANQIIQKPVKQVIQQLKKNHHSQIADFIQLITITIDLLSKAEKERKFLLQNMQMVYQLTTSDDNQFSGLILENENFTNFFQRMNFSSISDMMRKISRKKLVQTTNVDIKQFQKLKNKVAEALQSMLLNFSQIQRMIQDFIRSPDAIVKLKKVNQVLRQKFTKDNTKSTLQQIINLLKDVRLFKYEKQAYQLEYLWDSLQINLLSQQEFINGFTRLNGLYKEQSQLGNSRNLESQLSRLGFVKN